MLNTVVLQHILKNADKTVMYESYNIPDISKHVKLSDKYDCHNQNISSQLYDTS